MMLILAGCLPPFLLPFFPLILNTWNISDQITELSGSLQSLHLVQFLSVGWMWFRVLMVHTVASLQVLKNRFTESLSLCASKAMWDLGLTQPPNFCLLKGQCTCCGSFLTIDKSLIHQILLWMLLKCVPHVCQGYLVLNFLCERITECSFLLRQ